MECRDYEVTEEKIFTTEALRALRSARENFSQRSLGKNVCC